MKNLFNVFILFLLLVWPAVAFGQNCCMNDSDTVREIQFPLTEKGVFTISTTSGLRCLTMIMSRLTPFKRWKSKMTNTETALFSTLFRPVTLHS